MTRQSLYDDIHFCRFIHRILLESPSETPDGFGGSMTTWALVAEVWGELRALFGNEVFDDDRKSATSTHLVVIRWREGLTPDHRFRFGGRTFQIRSILDRGGRKRFLECRCEEVNT